MLELGLNPLCVTATTDELSERSAASNIENIKKQGVDYIEVSMNPVVRRGASTGSRSIQVGDISWPEHVTIFTIPVRMAVQMGIRLDRVGRESAERIRRPRGGEREQRRSTRRWLEEFGGLLGLRVTDLVGHDGIERTHLIQYTYPTDEELQRVGVTGIFLGYYLPWDGYANALCSRRRTGSRRIPTLVEGSLVNYENLDNCQTGIHDYFKFLKYGFGRATDIACNARPARAALARRRDANSCSVHDGKFPWTYLGEPLEEMLGEIDMTLDEFVEVCDRFTNKRSSHCDNRGRPDQETRTATLADGSTRG